VYYIAQNKRFNSIRRRILMPSYPIVHVEISAKDPAAASKFYAELAGWKIDHDPNFDYYQFSAEGGPGGGFVVPDGKQYNAGDVVIYLGVDDIDATLKKVVSLGGQVLLPKTEIPGIGWYAFFSDPTGNRLALYKSITQPS
jgi:predicted enzyme related to lactoylglutathione lyase